jgi:rubredoxin
MKSNILLGAACNSSGKLVIVMAVDQVSNFAVWDQSGTLYIYDDEQGDVLDPLHADTVWEAIELFRSWVTCEPVL